MARRNPGVATVELDVTRRNAKPQVVCDLVPDELQAIGLVAVQWAHLEHALYFRSHNIASDLGIAPPKDILNLSFTRRLQVFRDLANKLDLPKRNKWLKVADHIANAEGLRHKVTHGLWIWDSAEGDEIVAVSSLRPPHEFEAHMSLSKLRKLADRLGELIFDLSFPGGVVESLMTVAPISPRSKKYKLVPFVPSSDQGKDREA